MSQTNPNKSLESSQTPKIEPSREERFLELKSIFLYKAKETIKELETDLSIEYTDLIIHRFIQEAQPIQRNLMELSVQESLIKIAKALMNE